MEESLIFTINEIGVSIATLLICRGRVITNKLTITLDACTGILHQAKVALQPMDVHAVVSCHRIAEDEVFRIDGILQLGNFLCAECFAKELHRTNLSAKLIIRSVSAHHTTTDVKLCIVIIEKVAERL